ncbi:hypothetical protein KDA00_04280 [Candidatus Saccharibacteria bacterium]|nr:hypothetical protein [Candidatus Saccharibacteria bacterium]
MYQPRPRLFVMARMGVETEGQFGVIETGPERPPIGARFCVEPLSDSRFQVRHPFHGPRTFGDGSVFSDRFIDTAAVLLLDTLPYLVDSRKLNRISRFETRPYAGEFAQLGHCVSLGIMGAEFAGGPLDVFDGLYNDASHVYDGHQGDDNYQGHGKENFHDLQRHDFYTRSGLIDRFLQEGVLSRNGHGHHFGNTRLYIGTLLDEDESTVRNSFMSNKHPARRMDEDRFQYNEEERLLIELFRHRNDKDPLRVPFALAQAAINGIQRSVIVEDGEGDQLVFMDPELAAMSATAYGEHNALHWCEAVQDLVNDLLNLAERYFFVCDDDYARDFQYFYPRDYLHTSAQLMFEHFDKVAQSDPFMHWILTTAESIARDQRQKMADIIDGKSVYSGPNPPDGVDLTRIPTEHVEGSFKVEDDRLVVVLPKGKMRTVDPRVTTAKTETRPLSALRPSVAQDVTELHQWIGNYTATIYLENSDVIDLVHRGIELVGDRWKNALSRTNMPDSEFQRNIADANDYVYSKGKIIS